MFTAYVAVTILAAAANAAAAVFDFARADRVLANMTKVGVPRSWLVPLGALKAAGALGLLVGIGVPLLGVAASAGLVLFFVGAVITHIRAHAEALSYAYPGTFLLLAVGSLVPRLASW
jgi:DoxX-like family